MQTIAQFTINGTTPFHCAASSADQCLAQAHALLTLLAGAHDTCQAASEDVADSFDNIRHEITARALDGIASLVGFAQHFTDEADRKRAERKATPERWAQLVQDYETASAALANSTATDDETTDRMADAQTDAFDAMMLAPAPNAAALAYKLAEFRKITGGDSWHTGEAILAQIEADARRLA